MRNLFWMIVGAVIAYFVIARGRELLHRLTPRGVAEQVEKKGHEAASSFGDFYATFKAASATREAELRDELNIPAPSAS